MKTLTKEAQEKITPIDAIELLKEGNQRFANNLKVSRNLLQQANETREGQWPFATILSCMDSRTSSELVFDQGLGDIFSVRVAGNIINTDILGSMEYACQVAGSKLIVVLGHSHCGAVKGACDHVEMGNLTDLLTKLQPAIYEEKTITDPKERNSKNQKFVENVAAINVRRSVKSIISRSYILEQLIAKGRIAIIGAMYDLDTGLVDFYNDTLVDERKDITLRARA
jgi:carbonic anhydrase